MSDAKQKALNSLAKGAGITAIAMFASKALTYLYRITIARFVGPDAYGQLSIALMVVGLGGTISLLAFHKGLRKFIPEFRINEDEGKIKGAVLSSLYMAAPLSLVITLITFFGAEFIAVSIFKSAELIPVLKIMSVVPFFGTLASIFLDTTVGFNKIIYRAGTFKILENLIQLLVTASLVIIGFEVVGAAWGYIAGTITSAILGFYFMEKKVGPIIFSNVKPDYQHKKLLNFSSPLLLSGIITTVLGWADTALLGYYMTEFEVGLYNAALPTAMLVLLPHHAIGSLAVTSFSELKEKDEESIESSLQTATYWVFSLVLPTSLIMFLFSEQVLNILFGSVYTQASVALSILSCGYLLDSAVGRVGSFLQSKEYTKYILYNNVAALGLNIGLNIVLIPVYGIVGAAIATAGSTILTNLLMFIEVWKKEGVISIPFKRIGRVILTAILPLAFIIGLDNLLFDQTPFWFLFVGCIIYFILYLALFLKILGLGEDEKEVFLRIGEITGFRGKVQVIIERLGKI
jgi:O-antigen/teichoic acid export membrane protein